MKLVRYGASGAEKPGIIDADGQLRDLSGVVDDIAGEALSDLGWLQALELETLPKISGHPRLGPCVAGSGKFLGIGLNYSDHAAEAGMQVPSEPVVFFKATSAISGANDPIILPRGSQKTDWEVELGVVIGRGGKYIDEQQALAHVAGYCLVNDVSERAYQIEMEGQWSKGKGCDSFGPIGPWLVTADAVEDAQNLRMWLDVNGERMQEGSTKTMVYGVAHLVSYLSRFFSLHPGDIITTGTPPGVGMGRTPPRYLRAGDVVRLGIEGLGEQRQEVIEEA